MDTLFFLRSSSSIHCFLMSVYTHTRACARVSLKRMNSLGSTTTTRMMMRAVCFDNWAFDVIEPGIQLSNARRVGKSRDVENIESTCYSLILEMKTKRERRIISSFLLEAVNELVCDNILGYLAYGFLFEQMAFFARLVPLTFRISLGERE